MTALKLPLLVKPGMDGNLYLCDDDDRPIAILLGTRQDKNAASDAILRAVNAHAALVEACRSGLNICDNAVAWPMLTKTERRFVAAAAKDIREALAAAEPNQLKENTDEVL
jgi:hypothetical protein